MSENEKWGFICRMQVNKFGVVNKNVSLAIELLSAWLGISFGMIVVNEHNLILQ